MGNNIAASFRKEGEMLGEAAKAVISKPSSGLDRVKSARVAFKEGTTTNKVTILGGVMTGVTLALQGARHIQGGFKKNEDGKRDLATAAVGAAEMAGGLFVTALFYERLKLTDQGCDTGLEV